MLFLRRRRISTGQSVQRRLVRLVLTASVPFVVAILIAAVLLGLRIWNTSIRALETKTVELQRAIDTTLREAIVAYLRAKTETAVSMIETIDATDRDAPSTIAAVRERFLDIEVVESGYVYVIDDSGRVIVHPDPGTQDRVIPTVEPVPTQLRERSGYIEYTWQNSFEPLPFPKALYMLEYTPRGWIVAATSYRSEFVDLVDRERLVELIGTSPVETGSYSVVVNRAGDFVVHPDYAGRHIAEFLEPSEATRILDTFFSQDEGTVRYLWPDPRRGTRRPKLLVFRYLPDFDWVIATTIDIATTRRPVLFGAVLVAIISVILVAVVVHLSMRMARTVSEPLVRLADAAAVGEAAPTLKTNVRAPRELIAVTDRYNALINRIQEQQSFLQKNVNEKTVLIREIHHRVKNNLQVIASLLNLQSSEVNDSEDAHLFHRSRDRVISIAMVHEQLYQTDDLSMIPFDLYLDDLVSHLRDTHANAAIKLDLDCDRVSLGIDRAVPCGLIINELISNAYKHAFVDGTDGTITVAVRDEKDGRCTIVVADTGRGMQSTYNMSLGLTLVHTLVEQIGGVMDVTVNAGTRVSISFTK